MCDPFSKDQDKGRDRILILINGLIRCKCNLCPHLYPTGLIRNDWMFSCLFEIICKYFYFKFRFETKDIIITMFATNVSHNSLNKGEQTKDLENLARFISLSQTKNS